MKRLFAVLIILGMSACAQKPPTPQQETPSMQTIRYLALGDSYTIGEAVHENERWPMQLAQKLKSNGFNTEVTIIARTGWTTDELWQGIQAAPPTPPYDMVSLLIGVNNQYRGYNTEEYRQQFNFLLNKAIEYSGGNKNRVFVVSIPDWGITPFAEGRDRAQIAKDIDLYNSINKEESDKQGILYFDITPISRQTDPELVASDGLHPSGKMYSQWVDLIYPQVSNLLKEEK
jgi:lysophospholipase L1-like esterase